MYIERISLCESNCDERAKSVRLLAPMFLTPKEDFRRSKCVYGSRMPLIPLELWLTILWKCSKWRLSKKRGLVADD